MHVDHKEINTKADKRRTRARVGFTKSAKLTGQRKTMEGRKSNVIVKMQRKWAGDVKKGKGVGQGGETWLHQAQCMASVNKGEGERGGLCVHN